MQINMIYTVLDPRFDPEHLGLIPSFLSENDPRSAREQLDANYQHGGGFRPLPGWRLNPVTLAATYPGDPPLKPFCMTHLRDEKIYFYPYSQVMVLQKDGSFEIARMD